MQTSAKGRRFIEGFEGLILSAYDDFGDHIVQPGQHIHGTLTIGYGHTTAAGPPKVYVGQKITKDEADAFLAADLHAVENSVNHFVKVPLNQDQFDALVSFDFNTGALGHSNVLVLVNAGHFDRVRGALGQWVHSKGQVLAGLVRRRHEEAALFEGKWK